MSQPRYKGRKRSPAAILAAGSSRESDLTLKLNTLTGRVDNIVAFLQLDPNILAFGVGQDPGPWPLVDGLVPLVDVGSTGLNPPTIAGDTITINSPGLYETTAQFAIDIISGNNSAFVEINVNGVPKGVVAGVEFSGGQAAPINQPTARDIELLSAGDTITFVASELGTDQKLLYWPLSGGSCTQLAFDFDAFTPVVLSGIFVNSRFLPEEIENMGQLIKGEKWQPGPPPSDEETTKLIFFIGYIMRFAVDPTDPYIVQYVNHLEAIGIIGSGRAAQILSP